MRPAADTQAAAWGQLHSAISQLGSGVNRAVSHVSAAMSDDAAAMLYDVAGAAFYVHRELWLELTQLSKSVNAISAKVTGQMDAQIAGIRGGMQSIHDSVYGALADELAALAAGVGA